ncbi:MAG: hypothetical protein MI746_08060 [Pseudomonadales bacterium]|nr:hypothetical protein [Pseudomonadales bacterium]
MDLDKLNSWLSLLANIGVLLGIVFLVYEIQQNTNSMQSQTRNELSQQQIDWLLTVGTDEYSARAYNECTEIRTPPASAEDLSCIFIYSANLRMWENEWYQYNQGLFEEDEYLARKSTWANALSIPNSLNRQVYDQIRDNLSVDFQEEIDSIIIEIEN